MIDDDFRSSLNAFFAAIARLDAPFPQLCARAFRDHLLGSSGPQDRPVLRVRWMQLMEEYLEEHSVSTYATVDRIEQLSTDRLDRFLSELGAIRQDLNSDHTSWWVTGP